MTKTDIVAAPNSAIIEQVLIKGDLSQLTPQQRMSYYMEVCKSVGLNPMTKPFEYISLNGKLQLYALRGCTDQLRTIYKVSVTEMTESEREGVFIVTVKVINGEGRTDMAKGAVPLAGLKGEALANAMMKAETKAKRRATLSVCGLGWLDESEVESIQGAKVVPQPDATPSAGPVETAQAVPVSSPPVVEQPQEPAPEPPPAPSVPPTKDDMAFARTVFEQVTAAVKAAKSGLDIEDAVKANADGLKNLKRCAPANWKNLKEFADKRRSELATPAPEAPEQDEIPA